MTVTETRFRIYFCQSCLFIPNELREKITKDSQCIAKRTKPTVVIVYTFIPFVNIYSRYVLISYKPIP